MAQSADDLFSLRNQNDISLSAGVELTLPFGAQRLADRQDQARLGLTLSIDRAYRSRNSAISDLRKSNLLELGVLENGDPNLMLLGQDIYGPVFDPLYSKEDGKGGETQTLLIIGGLAAATVVATVILVDETEDLFECAATFGLGCEE